MDSGVDQLSHDDLVQLVVELQAEVVRLRDRVAELEGKNPTVRLDESYSVEAEEKRRREQSLSSDDDEHNTDENNTDENSDAAADKKKRRKQKSSRRGRRSHQSKIDQADEIQLVLPDGYDIAGCTFVRERPVWRIVDGRARRVVYEIYRGPNGEKAHIPGVPGRSEFGIEIHVAVAFQVFITGLSLDKVGTQLKFFWQLDLQKSQLDALLNQLSSLWENEFETLCDLLATSAVVHADETSWSINSVWAFLSEQSRVLLFGCRKDGDTLAGLLSKDEFAGVVVSDDAAVYQGFGNAQKCWAHLLRKAIRQHLLFPDNDEYRGFLDGLLDVFHRAKRIAADRRFSEAGRTAKVSDLENDLSAVCMVRCEEHIEGPVDEDDREFYNLVHEVVRLMLDDELFTFVIVPEVDATNNEAERSLRPAAMDRRTGRTNKTLRGARRRTVLVSVLESLKLHLADFTLANVLAEATAWLRTGTSLFDQLRLKAGLDPPGQPRLKKLVPEN